jgi:hypothetical protein
LSHDNPYRVEFDATWEDFADVELRILKRSPVVRRWRRRDAIVTSIVSGVGIFMLLGILDPRIPLDYRLVFAAAWMLGFPFLVHWMNRSQGSLRIQELLREQLGEGPIHVVIELRPDGVWVRQANVELLFDWKDATAVDDTSDVEVILGRSSVVARARAFIRPAQRVAFVERARELMRAHNAPRSE